MRKIEFNKLKNERLILNDSIYKSIKNERRNTKSGFWLEHGAGTLSSLKLPKSFPDAYFKFQSSFVCDVLCSCSSINFLF